MAGSQKSRRICPHAVAKDLSARSQKSLSDSSYLYMVKFNYVCLLIAEDSIVAQHFYQLWLDNNIAPDSIDDNWLQVTLELK